MAPTELAISESGYANTDWFLVPHGAPGIGLGDGRFGDPLPLIGGPIVLVNRRSGAVECLSSSLAEGADLMAGMEPVGP